MCRCTGCFRIGSWRIPLIEAIAHSRAGLAGNPSDGYFGKIVSFIVRDFAATVTLTETEKMEIVLSDEDRPVFDSLRDMVGAIRLRGFYGGERLMKAAVRRFAEHCDAHGLALHDRNFTLRYRSTIPRCVGMAGSSALITATLGCLMKFYEVDIPKPLLATLIWGAENEDLGISAGLMDRVIQVYEGCVFMDLDRADMEQHGYGRYEELDVALLPKLYIAYRSDLAEGSEVFHNAIRERWLRGEPDVVKAMGDFAHYAQEIRDLLVAGRGREIGPLIDKNFDLRSSLYTLSPGDLEMVERARSIGASAKFCGSGGAIVGTYDDDAMYARLEKVFEGTGTISFRPTIG